eukprot:4364631-Pleurochrysis_carterae.AAC.1
MPFGLRRHWFANECARAWYVLVGVDPGKRVRREVARCETGLRFDTFAAFSGVMMAWAIFCCCTAWARRQRYRP